MAIAGLSAPATAAPGHGNGTGTEHAADQRPDHPAATHAGGTGGSAGDPGSPQPLSTADQNPGGANGKCPGGPYCSTRDGSPSGNGNGGGRAVGNPCAGCVGRADNKNPGGQYPGPSDRNAGYECDRNHGIGRSNPAHTGCQQEAPPPGCTDDCGGETPPPGCTDDCGTTSPPTGCTHDCGTTSPPTGCTHDCGTTSPPTGCPGRTDMPPAHCRPVPPVTTSCGEESRPCLVSPPRTTTHAQTAAGPHVGEVVGPHRARTVSGPAAGTLPNTGAPDTLAAELAGALLLVLGGLALGARGRRSRA